MSTFRKPKATPASAEPIVEALLGFSCKFRRQTYFVPKGSTLRADDPIVRGSPWTPYFVRRPYDSAEYSAAQEALRAYKAKRQGTDHDPKPAKPAGRAIPLIAQNPATQP